MTHDNRERRRGSKGRVVVVVLLIAAAGVAAISYASSRWFGGSTAVEIKGARVHRGRTGHGEHLDPGPHAAVNERGQ